MKMKMAWHILRRMVILVLAAVWFETSAEAGGCQTDNELCGHSSSATTVCDCDCHPAIEPLCETTVFVEHRKTGRVHSSDETIRDLLLPNDIFRPPLTNS